MHSHLPPGRPSQGGSPNTSLHSGQDVPPTMMAQPQSEGLGPIWASGFVGCGPSFARHPMLPEDLRAFSLWATVGSPDCPHRPDEQKGSPKLRSGRHQGCTQIRDVKAPNWAAPPLRVSPGSTGNVDRTAMAWAWVGGVGQI